MEKYGTVFDKNFNLKRDQFRNLIAEYYQNPTLQKPNKEYKNQPQTPGERHSKVIYIARVDNNLLLRQKSNI